MNSPTLALIDGDALVFAAGFSNEKSYHGQLIDVKPVHFALQVVSNIINKIMNETECQDYKIYLGSTDKSNFRYDIAKTQPYKGKRKDQKRPEHEVAIRDYLFKRHSAIEVKGMEVDDALGIEQYTGMDLGWEVPELDCDTIICTNDKDLDMVPGWHYDMDFGKVRKRKKDGSTYKLKAYKNKRMYFVTDPGFVDLRRNPTNKKATLCGAGYLWFCCQLLLGDKTDDIPSLSKGYGPVHVWEILKDCKTEMEGIKTVYEEYKKVLGDSLTEEQIQSRLMEIAQLVWIRRKLDNDIIFRRSWLK